MKVRAALTALASAAMLLGASPVAYAASTGSPAMMTVAPNAASIICPVATVIATDDMVQQQMLAASAGTAILVSDPFQLQAALSGAKPGVTIDLADGVYSSSFEVPAGVSGQDGSPITVCGSPDAIISSTKSHDFYLNGTKLMTPSGSASYMALVAPVNWWVLEGFTITGGNKGLDLAYASYDKIISVTIHDTSGAGIHVESFSSHNDFEDDLVYNTGAEAVYNGSAVSNWPFYSQSQPDGSDFNAYNGLVLYGFAADGFDIKEGTAGTLVEDSVMDGSSQTKAKAWIDVKGDYALVAGNNGTNALQDGFGNHVVTSGGGQYNTFELNSGMVNAHGYGFRVDSASVGTTVDAGQQVAGAASGYSNWPVITPRYATVADAFSAWVAFLAQNGMSFS